MEKLADKLLVGGKADSSSWPSDSNNDERSHSSAPPAPAAEVKPSFSDPAAETKAKVFRFFGRGQPIPKARRGGKPADVFLWSNRNISAGVLGGATAIWILFELLGYHLLTFVCHGLIFSLGVLFLWSNASSFINKYTNDDSSGSHRGREAPDAVSLAWCGYLLVAAPVVAGWFGLADEPGPALVAFGLLLLGVGFIGLTTLAPRLAERAQQEEEDDRAVVANDGNDSHRRRVVPDASSLAWCGYLLVAAPVGAGWFGLADEPGPVLVSFGLLLLGVSFIGLATLAPRPAERAQQQQQQENHAVVVNDDNNNHKGHEVPDAASLAWCGYLLVAAPVVASWFSLADEAGAAFLAHVLLLLGAGFIVLAMLAPAKLKTL